MTLAGIEPATFRFVAQHLNYCATAVPYGTIQEVNIEQTHTAIPCFNPLVVPKTRKWPEINILYYIISYYIFHSTQI